METIEITYEQLKQLAKEEYILVDVRTGRCCSYSL